jgi:hypothetical protein
MMVGKLGWVRLPIKLAKRSSRHNIYRTFPPFRAIALPAKSHSNFQFN